MDYKYTSKNEMDTIELAENIESEKFENMVICLKGDLGSGKTLFVKGFAKSLGIQDSITSPSFSLVKEYYSGEMPLFHMDIYRLEKVEDSEIFEEYFYKNGITIIEWAEMMQDALPEERLEINIRVVDENTRLIIIKPFGSKYEELCESVL